MPLAIFYPFLFFTLQTFGLVYTSSAEAGIIHATVPIFTMLLASLLLKERSGWAQKLFTVLSVTGIISIFVLKCVSFESSSTLGIVLILLSALSNAVYSVMARKLTQKQPVLDITFIMSMIGFVLFNLMSAVQHAAEGRLYIILTRSCIRPSYGPFCISAFCLLSEHRYCRIIPCPRWRHPVWASLTIWLPSSRFSEVSPFE